MVRAIVGTMVEIGSGKLKPADLRNVIEAKNRGVAGTLHQLMHHFYREGNVGYDF